MLSTNDHPVSLSHLYNNKNSKGCWKRILSQCMVLTCVIWENYLLSFFLKIKLIFFEFEKQRQGGRESLHPMIYSPNTGAETIQSQSQEPRTRTGGTRARDCSCSLLTPGWASAGHCIDSTGARTQPSPCGRRTYKVFVPAPVWFLGRLSGSYISVWSGHQAV